MARHLNQRQRNNLQIGNGLAAEVAASTSGRRAFLVITPYHDLPPSGDPIADRRRMRRFSHFLTDPVAEDVRYGYSLVEVDGEVLDVYLREREVSDNAALETTTQASATGLATLDELEQELLRHMEDLTALRPAWWVVPWISR